MQTEHRLTHLEVVSNHHSEAHEEHYETTDQHRDKLNFHERIILVILGILSILLQEKFPSLAAFLKGMAP